MGRVFLVEFDQTPDIKFYLCSACPAHIALRQEFRDDFSVNELPVGLFQPNDHIVYLFRTAINVNTLSSRQDRKVGAHTVADVYCTSCGKALGIKFIEVANDDATFTVGYFLLRRDKLKKWNGYEIV